MFDIAWSELFVIGAVALVAIGPKDLPKAMLMLGKATRQVRQMGHQFRQQLDQLNYEVEIAAQAAEAEKQSDIVVPPAGPATEAPKHHAPK
jgi:sec-independent protein translocase protein TatB